MKTRERNKTAERVPVFRLNAANTEPANLQRAQAHAHVAARRRTLCEKRSERACIIYAMLKMRCMPRVRAPSRVTTECYAKSHKRQRSNKSGEER